MKTFVEPQFGVTYLYELKTSEFLRRHLCSLTLELCQFMSFKQKRILMKRFVDPQFEVM